MDSNEYRGYEGYGYYNTSSSGGADSQAYTSFWETGRPSAGGGATMSRGGGGGGASGPQGQRAPGPSGKSSESPDSIIAKINQRLDLLSRDSGGKNSQESSFSFEAFQSYMPVSKEPYRFSTETGGCSEGAAGPPQTPENHSAGRPGKGGASRRGGGSGGNKNRGGGNRGGGRGGHTQQGRAQNRRSGGGGGGGPQYPPAPDPYMRYGMPPPPMHPHQLSSSKRLSARWNELNYMGPHSGMGPQGGALGQLPSLFPGRPLAPPDFMGPPGPQHHPPAQPHGMMGPRFPAFPPYGLPGPWQRPGRKRSRSEREARQKARGGAKNTEGKKKRRRTESDGEESEHREDEEDNADGVPEEVTGPVTGPGTGEEGEKKPTAGGEEEEEEEPKKKSRGRRSKEKQQKERSKMLFACSLCKFRTADSTEIHTHLESQLHRDIIGFLEGKMPDGTAKFLQEYTVYRNKKILKKRQEVFDKDGRAQKADPFTDLAQDEFCRRIEAAHCMACDMVIPGLRHLLQQHLASKEHLRNRQAITDQFKMSSVQIAKSILSNKNISQMLEKHLKGEDPFTEEVEDQETQEGGAAPAGEGTSGKEGPTGGQTEGEREGQTEGETEGERGPADAAQSTGDAPQGAGAEGSPFSLETVAVLRSPWRRSPFSGLPGDGRRSPVSLETVAVLPGDGRRSPVSLETVAVLRVLGLEPDRVLSPVR
ncbi:A-kinase anchor protein 8-like [Conger conger]|uniref:A-kinase anchor protein 8-like n=1 Tax=Conger conger TaxID=82655 RepID=UPI002A5A930B|nr:A-kinase anchor protein 8-like [Conger conger]